MKAPGSSLHSRIVWTTTIVAAAAMAAMTLTVVLVLSALTTTNIDRRLSDQASAVSTTIKVGTDGAITASETPDDSIDDTTWVYDSRGELVEGPRAGPRVTETVTSLSRVDKRTRFEALERVFLADPVRVDGKKVAVVVVEASLEPYESTRDDVLIGLLGVGAVVTAGSAAVADWAMRRTLAPVKSMASRAEDWSEHDLESRFEATGTDDEFARLGRTLNVLLDRVAGALRSEQQLTAELAHELRTPLTAIRGEAELTRMADLPPEVDARQARLVALVDRMSDTITSLLAIARGEHRSDARTSFVAVVAAVTDHGIGRPDVDITVDDTANPELAAPLGLAVRALAPLVENAVRHSRSEVLISVTTSERMIDIAVTDDGAGITQGDPETLFESGMRAAAGPGAGLGLALARRIARTLGGDVNLVSASTPTTFVLSLPRF